MDYRRGRSDSTPKIKKQGVGKVVILSSPPDKQPQDDQGQEGIEHVEPGKYHFYALAVMVLTMLSIVCNT